jgi:hypothetical protein
VLIAVMNVKFHLFQEVTNQFTVMTALEKVDAKTWEMIDILEMTEENQDVMTDENLVVMTDFLETEKNLHL